MKLFDPFAPAGAERGRSGIAGRRSPNTTQRGAPEAATAASFGTEPPPRRLRLLDFKPVERGALRGFCRVELPIGLVLHDVTVFVGSRGPWATLPQRPVLDREGRHVRINDRGQYAPTAEWRTRELADGFSAAVIAAVREAYPNALDGAAA